MATLSKQERKRLEGAVQAARVVAEKGSRKAMEGLLVHAADAAGLSGEERALRSQLRAHGRQLGDKRAADGSQPIDHLVQACAYEHWHRLLFARFLAENQLLLEPSLGVAISLEEVQELARARGCDWLDLAAGYAQRMLPAIFRPDDPVLQVSLPPETRQELEGILEELPAELFTADDSLGWVYQFWQGLEKDRVNKSEVKIGADEIALVTQLFTEDYMVLFLLHNTLGAWWTAKRLAEEKDPQLPGYEWSYLRLNDDGTPAAGVYDGWPRTARELRILDPCMGSGHFLTFALPIVTGMRMEEEGMSLEQAITATLRENLFGLEIDERCSQIAAFNLALTAWRLAGGHLHLPKLNLACSGVGVNASEEHWTRLAGNDVRARDTMRRLYALFRQAPVLGSLIDPLYAGKHTLLEASLAADLDHVRPILHQALASDCDVDSHELAVAASGLAEAAGILASRFTLVVTNVPYLGRGKQAEILRSYCEEFYPAAKPDLATCFVERTLRFCSEAGSVALVTPQNWLFLTSYKKLRENLLKQEQWDFVARLGPHAFETITGEVVSVALVGLTRRKAGEGHLFVGLGAEGYGTPGYKAVAIRASEPKRMLQSRQLHNAGAIVANEEIESVSLLSDYAKCHQGLATGDLPRFGACFWEVAVLGGNWVPWQTSPASTAEFSGRSKILLWEEGTGALHQFNEENKAVRKNTHLRGTGARGKIGVLVGQMRGLPVTIYTGDHYDDNTTAIIPEDPAMVDAVWSYCSSAEYCLQVRQRDASLKVPASTLANATFDVVKWRRLAMGRFPNGLPKPRSTDPTQWLFNGHPVGSDDVLQVAVARLLGYRWPRQTGSSFMDCPALGPDGLETHAVPDGIVCLSSLAGKPSAEELLRELLADAYGAEWSAAKLAELLSGTNIPGTARVPRALEEAAGTAAVPGQPVPGRLVPGTPASRIPGGIEEWLRGRFFEEHCKVFHDRPFIWHVWDGRKDGFHALVNYHKLAGPDGEGRRTLERLIYTYLGDWITRQTAETAAGAEGADGRLAAALHLRNELEKILQGEPPYDLFVRWKPLSEQPIGWEPDINDGVRLNIRPWLEARPYQTGRGRGGQNGCILRVRPRISYGKDRGKEPVRDKQDFPWFWKWDGANPDFKGGEEFDGARWNDLHYTRDVKQQERERAKAAGVSK